MKNVNFIIVIMDSRIRRFISEIRVSRIIIFMTYSDILIVTGWGLISPLIAVFITEQIEGATIKTAGIASTIYFLTKSFFQIPFARIIDKWEGEKDDYISMMIGSLLVSITPFFYAFIKTPIQLFVVQFMYGLGGALSYPSWLAIFTRHIDKKQEGLEWSLYYTATDLGAALSASLGGFIAYEYGFRNIFFLIGIVNIIGTSILLLIKSDIIKLPAIKTHDKFEPLRTKSGR